MDKSIPEDVVDADDALLVAVLGVANDRGTRLDPGESAVAVQDPVVGCHHLAFMHYCNYRNTITFRVLTEWNAIDSYALM